MSFMGGEVLPYVSPTTLLLLGGLMVLSFAASLEVAWQNIRRVWGFTFRQWFMLTTFGYSRLGLRQPEGFSAPVMFYVTLCERHGLVKTYPQSYRQRLLCPKCLEEAAG